MNELKPCPRCGDTHPDNWISVDTMPDRCGMSVLLVGVNRYEQTRVFQGFTGYMETGRLLFYSNIGDVDINNWDVTHWQPLPEPPNKTEPAPSANGTSSNQ